MHPSNFTTNLPTSETPKPQPKTYLLGQDKTKVRPSKQKLEDKKLEENFLSPKERIERWFAREAKERKALVKPLSKILHKGINKVSLADSTEGNASNAAVSTPSPTCDGDSQEISPRSNWDSQEISPRSNWDSQEISPRSNGDSQEISPRSNWDSQESSPRLYGDFISGPSTVPVEIVTLKRVRENVSNLYGVPSLEQRKREVLKLCKPTEVDYSQDLPEKLMPEEIQNYIQAKEDYEKATKELEEKKKDIETEFNHQVLTLKSNVVEWWQEAVESLEKEWNAYVENLLKPVKKNIEAHEKLKTLNGPEMPEKQ